MLNLGEFHGCGVCLVVVGQSMDPSACGKIGRGEIEEVILGGQPHGRARAATSKTATKSPCWKKGPMGNVECAPAQANESPYFWPNPSERLPRRHWLTAKPLHIMTVNPTLSTGVNHGPCVPLCARACSLRRRFAVVGYLNCRSAGLVSSLAGPDFPGLRGKRPCAHRLESPSPRVLQTGDCGTVHARGAGPSLLAAALSPIADNTAGGGA